MGHKGVMENNEILARIGGDVADASTGMFGVRDITIGMTEELYCRLGLQESTVLSSEPMDLFGCKVEFIGNRGMRWIVGYAGTAEEGE
jgi:hypothetical protein